MLFLIWLVTDLLNMLHIIFSNHFTMQQFLFLYAIGEPAKGNKKRYKKTHLWLSVS